VLVAVLLLSLLLALIKVSGVLWMDSDYV